MTADRSRLPSRGAETPFRFPDVRQTTLPNGLRVWLVSDRPAPVVSMLLLAKVGAADDPLDRPGLAALTGDMLDEGSRARTDFEIHDALARIGAHLDVEIGSDATLLSLTTLEKFAEQGLALLAELVSEPRMDPGDFARVRDLRLSRLLQLRDVPAAAAERAFLGLVYGSHPYGHVAMGTETSLRAISLDEPIEFHRSWYSPERSALIVVGSPAYDRLVETAERTFTPWHAAGRPVPVGNDRSMDRAVDSGPRVAIVDRPGAAQSELRVGLIGVPRKTPDYHELVVLNMLLGGQFVSRINLNLREGKGYTYGMRSSFDFRRGRGPFIVSGSVQTDATGASIVEIVAEIQAVGTDHPPTAEELDLAKAALTRGYPRTFETAEQIARAVTQLALYDLPDDTFTEFAPRIRHVGSEAVAEAARRRLRAAEIVAVVVGDRARVTPQLNVPGWGEPLLVAGS